MQQPKAAELLHTLALHEIDSRASMVAAWRDNPLLLQRQMCDCMLKGKQHLLTDRWRQVLSQANELHGAA